ncbi:SEC-C metal-binding domain-containing protein [Arenibacter nanhaiticus]|nr:SEC-C metal-binding domain-containing protein [Arenibacter nanhaiticus]
MKGKDTIYYPKLDEMVAFSVNWLPFKNWWEEIVFRDKFGNEISRSSLIKTSTNQDGGAHVDEALDEIYYDLSKNNSLETSIFDGETSSPIPNPEKAAIRQIGHEVLKTLLIDYEKKQTAKVDIWLGGSELIVGNKPSPLPKNKKIGRNEKCPCGSSKKYKHCHGK